MKPPETRAYRAATKAPASQTGRVVGASTSLDERAQIVADSLKAFLAGSSTRLVRTRSIGSGSSVSPGKAPRYEPKLLDSEAGVGTQAVVADVNEDGLPDILTAARAGAFLFLNQ